MSDPIPFRPHGVLTGAHAIAKALGVCPNTVHKLCRSGALPAFRTGSATSPWRVTRAALAEFRREVA